MSGDVGAEVAAVLHANGLTDNPAEFDSDIHSWRCSYPDIYGPCACFAELVADLTNALNERVEAAKAGALAPIRAMHFEDDDGFCHDCGYGWPCSTARGLDPEATP